jgi:transposase
MNVLYSVELTSPEREQLLALTRCGTAPVRRVKRANILLMSERGHSAVTIEEAGHGSVGTVYRVRQRFVEQSLEAALSEEPRLGSKRMLDEKQEAILVALACSPAPKGCAHWTLRLLSGRFVELADIDSISHATVGRRLHEKDIKPWQKKMWCIPDVDAEFVAHMEDVLELYAEPADPERPVVCIDETLKQLVADVRERLPQLPGSVEKYDYHYRRNGVANLFVMTDRHRRWRHVKVTEQKTSSDFAECMRDLVDIHYPAAKLIRVVCDNLNTHGRASLYKAFPPAEALRILKRIEFHHTPKHASWLDMAEIEIGCLNKQCLDRRIPDMATLKSEVAAWEDERNRMGATIRWLFSAEDARKKMGRAYPKPTSTGVATAAQEEKPGNHSGSL